MRPPSPLQPERDGRGGIRGGCSTCFALFDLYQAKLSLDIAHREFLRRAIPWTNVHARQKKALPLQDEDRAHDAP